MTSKKLTVKKQVPQRTSWPAFSPVLSIVLIVLVALIVGAGLYYLSTKTKSTNDTVSLQTNNNSNANTNQLLGGDADEHGCIGSAGYSWCEEKQKCLRIWEEDCSVVTNDNANNNLNVNVNTNVNTNTVGWQKYTSTTHKYSIQYPTTWTVDNNADAPQFTPPGYTAGSMAGTGQALIIEPVDTINTNDIIISGPNPVYVNGLATTQQVEGGMVNYSVTYFPTTDGKYIRVSWSEDNQTVYPEYQEILSTFEFTQ